MAVRSMKVWSRRALLGTRAAAVPIIAAPRRRLAESAGVRALRFTRTHTGERLALEYFSDGTYLPDALSTVNDFLRDFRTSDVHAIDPALLDLLHGLAAATETSRPFPVISGYRSPATNEGYTTVASNVRVCMETLAAGECRCSIHANSRAAIT